MVLTMRKKLFKLHSWLALVAMIPLLVICITGSILVFKPEIDRLLMPENTVLLHTWGERRDLDSLNHIIKQSLPRYRLGTWEVFNNSGQADIIYVIRKGTQDWYKVYFDPYQGMLLSKPVPLNHELTDWLVELHYTFLMGVKGTFVAFVFALVLLALGVTGIVLYKNFWQRLLTLRWDKQLTVFFSDLHKMAGIAASPVLLILGLTGAYWNIAEFVHEVEGSAKPAMMIKDIPKVSALVSLDTLQTNTKVRISGFETTYIVMPYEQGKQISFYGKVPSNNPFISDYSSGASYSPDNGDFVAQWDIRKTSTLAIFLDSFRSLHFGTFGGLFTRIVWCFLGAMPLLLSVTGGYLWYVRTSKRKVAKRNRQRLTTLSAVRE